jgi:hypothetical protein
MICQDEWFGRYIVCKECIFCRRGRDKNGLWAMSRVSKDGISFEASSVPETLLQETKKTCDFIPL